MITATVQRWTEHREMRHPAFLDPRLPDRFWRKTTPEPNSGCWLWIAGVGNRQGYGSFWTGRRTGAAHRVAYEALIGRIDDELVLDHLCRTTCCVNPSHLEPVTQTINIVRGESPCAHKARQTHCKNGHLLDGDNLISWHAKRGRRACRACRNDQMRDRRRRREVLRAPALPYPKIGWAA